MTDEQCTGDRRCAATAHLHGCFAEGRQMPWRPGSEESGRVPPRICVQNARDALNQAYGQSDPRVAVNFMVTALDWQRRALEQMIAGEGS